MVCRVYDEGLNDFVDNATYRKKNICTGARMKNY